MFTWQIVLRSSLVKATIVFKKYFRYIPGNRVVPDEFYPAKF